MALCNINTADRDELIAVRGIGGVLADRIIAHRDQNGQFMAIEELIDIDGIAEQVLEELRDQITVDRRIPKIRPRVGDLVASIISEHPTHCRILDTINKANRPEDLLAPAPVIPHAEHHEFALDVFPIDDHGDLDEDDEASREKRKQRARQLQYARELLVFRNANYPLGLRHIAELNVDNVLVDDRFANLFDHLTHRVRGRWTDFPVEVPRRGPNTYDGVIHAALCHTGQVLFITADETTVLWDPNDTTAATFENPVNQPHLMPNGYSQLCGHHVFLSSGKLLSVGGGGYGWKSYANAGYLFDPVAKSWSRTANNMSEAKWYPTAVALGDERVLITCGDRSGDMDIYDEATNQFTHITGDDRTFPNLYPGLHLLPNHSVFYSRTGWGNAGPNGSPPNDSQSAYFAFTGTHNGSWHNIQNATANRTKGMSVMLLSNTPPYVRVMVVGGVGSARSSYEIANVSILSGTTSWSPPIAFPDGIDRSLASVVLLPNGTVFVAGGTTTTNSPCSLYNPATGAWTPMAALPSERHYHSVAILLPSGQVMMAGWNNKKIEIYDPPYMFANRPTIAASPALVHHGRNFVISSPEAETIHKVVLVRPMAVTHQTDSEQKVIEMANRHDHANPSQIIVTAPNGGHPHSYAQKGYYMLFAINAEGVPSEAKWIYLH